MRSPEGAEKDEIKKYLDSIGAWYVLPTTMGFGRSGTPDIIFCYRGKFGAIEVKREGKEPTVLQWRRMEEIERAGGYAAWGTAEHAIGMIQSWIDPT